MSDKIILFNPCKTCLTRAVCKNKCDDIDNHYTTMACMMFSITIFAVFVSVIILYLYLWNIFDNIIIKTILILTIFPMYKETIKEIKADKDGFGELNLFTKIFVLIISPSGFLVMWFFDKIHFDKHMNKHIFRFKPNLIE